MKVLLLARRSRMVNPTRLEKLGEIEREGRKERGERRLGLVQIRQ
jgi:hypothetical protein